MTAAITTTGLRKVYSTAGAPRRRGAPPPGELGRDVGAAPEQMGAAPAGEVVALHGLDLTIDAGEFFGVLGPNGAGKSTTIGILTTRVRPTAGRAVVAGADVVTSAPAVRQRIGVVPQRPNPDRSLDVLENLVFHATYFGISVGEARRRASAILDQLGIADKARAAVDALSGGQQQRLMIARALIHEPSVIFLDEPTVGLDPQARLALWEILRELHAQGRTIVMTTHYMEEADQLCERVAIIDHGQLLAMDTPASLKARAPGGTLIELELDRAAAAVLEQTSALDGVARAEAQDCQLRVFSERGGELIPMLIRIVEHGGRRVRDIQLREPSLETLFISLTGRKLE